MTQYVLLDTNILFRYVTQGEPGCESEHFDDLQEMVKAGKVKLLSSEVAELEFAGECKGLDEQLKSESLKIADKLTKALTSVIEDLFPTTNKPSNDKAWNEIRDLQPLLRSQVAELSDQIQQWHDTKLAESGKRIESVKSLMALGCVERLAFDHDIIVRTKRRFMSKRFKQAHKEAKPESDYNIIDSVVRYFETCKQKHPVLLCSTNTKHLALEVSKEDCVLHPSIADEFPVGSALFRSLADLLVFLREQKPIEQPSPEMVRAAIHREAEYLDFFDQWTINVGKLREALIKLNRLRNSLDGFDAWATHRLDPVYLHGLAAVAAIKGKNINTAAAFPELYACSKYTSNVLESDSFIHPKVGKLLEPIHLICSELIDMLEWMTHDSDEL